MHGITNGSKGTRVTVETVLGDVAHGGYVVARIDGKVAFITGGLPGERVVVELTETGKRFDRGRVVRVLKPHPERIEPPCPIAGVCGGCHWQHATTTLQRELKRRVVAEQLQRLAGVTWEGEVQDVQPEWNWRTRMHYRVVDGRPGLLAKRSHEVVPLPEEGCRIAVTPRPGVPSGVGEFRVVDAGSGHVSFGVDAPVGDVVEHADGREHRLAADGFWQVHPRAADTLVDAALRALRPQGGERAVDLYCGVGLFAGALAARGCDVLGVELDGKAVEYARRNVPSARFEAASVDRFLGRLPKRTDLVVLDPPRRGAGRAVVEAVARMQPRRIAYVACDPAALGRDLGYFMELGFRHENIEAFDLFPQTLHVEAMCTLVRA